MKQTITFIIFLFTMVAQLSVQADSKKDNRYEGFVITSDGDTLRGNIEFINPVYNELKVRFYNEKGKRTTYSTKDLVEYAFLFFNKSTQKREWVHYFRRRVAVAPLNSISAIETVFLQRVTTGKVTLYNFYQLENSKINSRTYIHNYYVEQQTPGGFDLAHISSDNYREYTKTLLAGNQQLFEKLGTYGFGFKYFVNVVKEHNKFLNGEPMQI